MTEQDDGLPLSLLTGGEGMTLRVAKAFCLLVLCLCVLPLTDAALLPWAGSPHGCAASVLPGTPRRGIIIGHEASVKSNRREINRLLRKGDKHAARDLLPLLYDELRIIARARMANLAPGQTLQTTALVHEAYMKLVGTTDPGWDSRGHFFAAATRAMRQILVDQARRKGAVKHGGDRDRLDVDELDIALDPPGPDILALHEALDLLEAEDARKAQIVMLRQFAGLQRDEVAAALGISIRTVDREWHYSIARLHQLMTESDEGTHREG